MNYKTMEKSISKVKDLLYKYVYVNIFDRVYNKSISTRVYDKIIKTIEEDESLPVTSNCKMSKVSVKFYTKEYMNKKIQKYNKENNIKDEDTIFHNCDTIIIRIGSTEWGFNVNNGNELYSETSF
jgi:hypothetical protein